VVSEPRAKFKEVALSGVEGRVVSLRLNSGFDPEWGRRIEPVPGIPPYNACLRAGRIPHKQRGRVALQSPTNSYLPREF